MKYLNKLNTRILAASFAMGASLALLACSDEESVHKIYTYDESLFALDSLAIPDSILESDSLFTWYMAQLEKNSGLKKSSSSTGTGIVPSSFAGSSDSRSAGEVGSSTGSGDVGGISSAVNQSVSSSAVVAYSSSEEPYDLNAILLPPAGFYEKLTIPAPAPQQGATISCNASSDDYKTFVELPLNAPFEVDRSMVIRCTEVNGEGKVLRSSIQTYFIGERTTMPVVALTVDNPGFFSRYAIMDCEGQDPYGCPTLMDDVEFPVHVEYFESGKPGVQKAWEVFAGISLMGNYSRTYEKKPVAIKMKKMYQDGSIRYPFFDVRSDRKKFKGFNLRNSGNRYVGDYVGDPVLTSLVEGSSVDYQRSRQVLVFYNGKYMGIHDLRERLNEHFVETNYKGIDSKSVDFVKHVKNTVTASGGTTDAYNAMLTFIASNDFSGENNEAYKQVQTMMDVGNYADYLAAEIYVANADWPSNNVRAWSAPGQPFKFVLFDLDQGFGWSWVSSDFQMNRGGMFAWMRHDRGEGRTGLGYFANIYIQLSKNPDFRRLFINHGAVMLNDYLTYERLEASLNHINSQLPAEEIERDQTVFYRPYSAYGSGPGHFDKTGIHLLEYGATRTASARNEYRTEFGLGEDISVTIAAKGNGKVLLDGMNLPRTNYTGTFFLGNDMLLTAVPTGAGVFVSWEDGSTENPRLVSPEDGSEYVAEFK